MTQQLVASGIPGLAAADVTAVSARRNEPDWLAALRREAWRLYESLELPDPGDEEWRRTNVREVRFPPVRALSASAPVAGREQLPASVRAAWDDEPSAARLVQQDSDVVYARVADELRARGVVICDLHTAAVEHEAIVREHLLTLVPAGEWKFLALNAALWSGGAFVYVPRGVEATLPVQLLTAVGAQGLAVFPRALVVAERESRLVLIDESVSPGAGFVSGAVELFLGDGATVEYYDINRWGADVYNFKTTRATLGRDATLTFLAAGIGSKLTKQRIDVEMPASGARAQLLGVIFGDGQQHFDYNTRQEHTGDHTVSDLQFKSALTDSASLVWYGVTRINPTASAAEANQTSRNLLLSEHAKAAPIPILEIEARDVAKCSHGATAGPVEEGELFYLESRGIPHDVAERMLVEGFFADVIDRIPNPGLRNRVLDAVLAKAGGVAGALTWDEVLAAK
jgi:Fe-S cluster assembly protein SufD